MISQYKVYGIIFHCYNDSGEKIKINIFVGFIIKVWKNQFTTQTYIIYSVYTDKISFKLIN